MSRDTLFVALVETTDRGALLLGQTADTLVVEATRSALLLERRAGVERLERDEGDPLRDLIRQELDAGLGRESQLHVVADEDELDDPGPAT